MSGVSGAQHTSNRRAIRDAAVEERGDLVHDPIEPHRLDDVPPLAGVGEDLPRQVASSLGGAGDLVERLAKS
jgi:hypothetical protein